MNLKTEILNHVREIGSNLEAAYLEVTYSYKMKTSRNFIRSVFPKSKAVLLGNFLNFFYEPLNFEIEEDNILNIDGKLWFKNGSWSIITLELCNDSSHASHIKLTNFHRPKIPDGLIL